MGAELATTDQQTDDTVEQSQDQAGEVESGVADGAVEEEASDDAETDDSEDEGLLSSAEIEAFKGKPEELQKALNRAWTKKTQGLAEERKQLEPYLDFISALDDPQSAKAAVTALASQLGLRIEGTAVEQREQVRELADLVRDDIVQALGPEYGDLADKLAPAMLKAAQKVAAETVKPVQAEQERIVTEAATAQAKADVELFEKSHPDFKKHEEAMVELSKKLTPSKGMSTQEYMSVLYAAASAGASKGDLASSLIKRINKAGKSESLGNRVPAREVKVEPSALPTFEEAASAALRGERF